MIESSKMKVLLLTTSFPLTPESMSGIFINRFIPFLPDDIELTILTPSDREKNIVQNERFNLRTFRYAPGVWQQLAHEPGGLPAALKRNKLLFLLLPFFLISLCWACVRESLRSDLIHANWSINGLVAGAIGRLTATPTVTSLRGGDVNRINHSVFHRFLVHACFILNNGIVTVSDSLAEFLADKFPRYAYKIETVSNGVDDSFYAAAIDRPCHRHIEMLAVGNLVPNKGVDKIIRALGKLKMVSEWHLTVLGDGEQRSFLEQLAHRQGISTMVSFKGRVAPADVAQYMRKADLFLFASLAEGRPNALMEAMAAGLPVIASTLPSVMELIRHEENGLLFQVERIDQFQEMIKYLLENPKERQRLGAAGHVSLKLRGMTWENTGSRYGEIYRQLVQESKGDT